MLHRVRNQIPPQWIETLSSSRSYSLTLASFLLVVRACFERQSRKSSSESSSDKPALKDNVFDTVVPTLSKIMVLNLPKVGAKIDAADWAICAKESDWLASFVLGEAVALVGAILRRPAVALGCL